MEIFQAGLPLVVNVTFSVAIEGDQEQARHHN
jgi:hypothetical protein